MSCCKTQKQKKETHREWLLSWIYGWIEYVEMRLRVETDGGDEGAEEGPGLWVAACLQKGLPVLWPWHDFALQAAVTQKVGQPHLGVSDVFADLHLVGDGDTAGGLTHVKRHYRPRHSQENQSEVDSHTERFVKKIETEKRKKRRKSREVDRSLDQGVLLSVVSAVFDWTGGPLLLSLYTAGSASPMSPISPVSLLSTTYQRNRDDVFGDNGSFCDDCRQRGGTKADGGCVWSGAGGLVGGGVGWGEGEEGLFGRGGVNNGQRFHRAQRREVGRGDKNVNTSRKNFQKAKHWCSKRAPYGRVVLGAQSAPATPA